MQVMVPGVLSFRLLFHDDDSSAQWGSMWGEIREANPVTFSGEAIGELMS